MSYKVFLEFIIISLIPICLSLTYLESEVSGKSTYYGGNPSGNACGYATVQTSTFPFGYYAACGGTVFDDGYGCGKCYEITCIGPYGTNPSCYCSSNTSSVIISCMDQCPECGDTHFDLDPTAMARIVGPGLSGTCGEIETTVRRVSCDYLTNIQIRAKSGTSSFWYGFHIDDIAEYGSVIATKLKSYGSSTYDTICDKSGGPSYWACSGGFPLIEPVTVKLTNDNNEELVFDDCITNFDGGAVFDCGSNFGGGTASTTPTPTAITLVPTTYSPTTSPCGVRNIKFVTVTESQIYWLAFYVLDVCTSCGTITNVQILDSSSFQNYVDGDNSDPRGFWAYNNITANHGGQAWTVPITVKITNSVSEILTFTDILMNVDGDLTFNANNNFCQSGVTATPTSITSAPISQPTASPVIGPSCGNLVKFTMQTGSGLWWLAFYIDDLCCGAVTKVEVKDSTNYLSYVIGVDSTYNYWQFNNVDYGSFEFTAPLTVRVTNSNNEVIEFVDVLQSVDPPNIFYGDNNFCPSTINPSPTDTPTSFPSKNPSPAPTNNRTPSPTKQPTTTPTNIPTGSPTSNPTISPTDSPIIPDSPTNQPTKSPTDNPTSFPSKNPSLAPTNNPAPDPTKQPTTTPTKNATRSPSNIPTRSPTYNPTESPTENPTLRPSESPITPGSPTRDPSNPTPSPTNNPSRYPTNNPTSFPSNTPIKTPSNQPSTTLPITPGSPTKSPFQTTLPTKHPTNNPTLSPTNNPISALQTTLNPSSAPNNLPTVECDDNCDDDDDDGDKKIRIKVKFWFRRWIIYNLSNIRCWLYEIFMKWFINFEFAADFDVCDIEVIVIGGTENTDGRCVHAPCLWNTNNQRRILLADVTAGNVSVSIMSEEEDTLNALNALSMDTMSNQLHSELMDRFNVDIDAEVEITEEQNKQKEGEDDFNMLALIFLGIGLLFIVLVVALVIFCCRAYKRKREYKKKDFATTQMTSSNRTGEHQTNIISGDDDEYENVLNTGLYDTNGGL